MAPRNRNAQRQQRAVSINHAASTGVCTTLSENVIIVYTLK